jgi:hypothetical protein
MEFIPIKPPYIFNFTIRYMNNSLPTRKNLVRWGISTSDCSCCVASETFLHAVAGCQSYLKRFTWRPTWSQQPIHHHRRQLDYRPDLLLSTNSGCLYIDELTVGFESNLQNNIKRKRSKYLGLTSEQRKHLKLVEFIDLSMSFLGIFLQTNAHNS